METIKSFKDLKVWQESINLALLVYEQSKTYPKDEIYGLTSQTRRSSVSVASNIAEGYGRGYDNELVRYLGIARGSLSELETQLYIAHKIGYIVEAAYNKLITQTTTVGKLIVGFQKHIKNG
jgi:four helix bundle protein